MSADADGGERDRIDHEAIRSTLEDYAVQNGFGSYSAIFGGTFAPSPHTQNLLLPSLDAEGQQPEPADDARDDGEVEAEAHAHAHAHSHAHTHEHAHPAPPPPDTSVPLHLPAKRGRGRPKGSKNKPKPRPPTPDPPSDPEPEPPRRKKGRPPKIRSEEEIAEIERRKEEKELGIKRKRGRPRKYPELGLVREMRLKKNREAVQEKIRMLEERRLAAAPVEGLPLDQAGLPEVGGQVEVVHQSHEHEHPGSHNHGHDEHDDHVDHADYDWPYQDGQTLLDVVRGVGMDMGDGERMSVGMGVLSGTSNGGVFSLADVTPTAS